VISTALARATPAPGRFQALDEGQPFAVLVDYAHTPDSLANVLTAARNLTSGRVIAVFGCGGDRDRGKRPQMGAIATRLAEVTIVTSDNPRSEEPEAIVDEILAGTRPDGAHAVEAIVERRAAVARELLPAGR
jgi:UDP-N-acetylmuramoyl-L-alanyl-D-glutamate--2,6-diaminopimelate ligase